MEEALLALSGMDKPPRTLELALPITHESLGTIFMKEIWLPTPPADLRGPWHEPVVYTITGGMWYIGLENVFLSF